MIERIAYDACPLCGDPAILDIGSYDCRSHPMYKPSLPAVMNWCQCFRCRHVFTDGYFGPAAMDVLFETTMDYQEPGYRLEQSRQVWATVVEKVAAHVRGEYGRWLDVGFGNGGLLLDTQEWGFDPLGIDLRPDNVHKLEKLGVAARCTALEALDDAGAFSVISMADVLEHMPFPPPSLRHAHGLLRQDGLLFLSMPNMDTALWRDLERRNANAYWIELEHCHNFTRARLFALLRECGFEPEWYGVSPRYVCGMDVIARRRAS